MAAETNDQNNRVTAELMGNKDLLIALGYKPDYSCATCGEAVNNKRSRFCKRGHDNHFLAAVIANSESGPLMRKALDAYFGRAYAN